GHLIVWRTDSLGMPLVEIVTEPQLYTPKEVEEAILLIGRICRSTNHVRYGIGASRQDVNVSVRGGRRVEIKGVPRAEIAARLVHGEAIRQVNLLKLMEELHNRGFTKPEDLRINITSKDVTKSFKRSPLRFLKATGWREFNKVEGRRPEFELGKGEFAVRAIKLENLRGTLDWNTQPGKTFADELRGRIRVVCGLDQQPILIHNEDLTGFESLEPIFKRLEKELDCTDKDSLLIVWGAEKDTISAVEEVYLRYADAIDGIPNETRQAFDDGHTDFERILPGPDRMYPDTDSPPIRVTRDRVERIAENLPPQPWVRQTKYSKAGIQTNTIFYLLRRGGADIVDAVVEETGADLKMAGIFFGEKLKGLMRKGVDVKAIAKHRWIDLFHEFAKKPELAENWDNIVRVMAESTDDSVEKIIHEIMHFGDASNWRDFARKVLAETAISALKDDEEVHIKLAMAKMMDLYRGLVPGRKIETYLRETVAGKPSKEE
ncbi:MAG: hypothetical protein ACP5G4_08230, partial [bacterium]